MICGHLHESNVSHCANCGYSIFVPDHSSDKLDISPASPVSNAITDAIAEEKDLDADKLPPLSDVIDQEALDTLVHDDRAGKIQFQYEGVDVTVHPSGAIDLEPTNGE